MPDIGRVTIGLSNNIKTIRLKQPTQTTIASSELQKKNLKVGDLVDVNDTVVGDGFTLVYDAVNSEYKTSPIANVDITIADIFGGTF